MFHGLKKREAKNCSNGVGVVRTWPRIFCCDDLRTFGGPSDPFSDGAPIDAGAAVRRTIPFENGHLEIWTAQSRRARQQGRADVFILRFYGNADRADRWPAMEAEMSNDRAVEIWGMNYPGFGGST